MAWPTVAVSGAAPAGSITGTGAQAFAHTIGASGTKLVVFVGQGTAGASDYITGVTWSLGGTPALTLKQNAVAASWCRAQRWELDSPTTGAGTVTVSYAAGLNNDQIFSCAISFDGAQATTGTQTSATGNTTNPSVTVADSASGDIVVSFLVTDSAVGGTTPGGTQIAEIEDLSADTDHNGQYQTASGANTVCSWTNSDSGSDWIAIGVAIKQALLGPTINTHPVNQRVPAGSTASYSVAATTSGGSLSYQWQSNATGSWVNISGETASSYTTGALAAGTAYAVRCNVTDSNGTVATNPADAWAPVSETPPWAGLYGRANRNFVRGIAVLPNSGANQPIFEDALFGPSAGGSNFTATGSGGIQLGGSATVAETNDYTFSAAGGLQYGGTAGAAESNDYSATSAGGILYGGSATTAFTFSYAITASGGVQLGGSAATTSTANFATSSSGGLVFGGVATCSIDVGFAIVGSGGVAFGGAATSVEARDYGTAASGGVQFGGAGTATFTRDFSATSAGGVQFGGTASVAFTFDFATSSSGGLALGGTASASFDTGFAAVGSGGLQFGGAGLVEATANFSASSVGGLVLGGGAAAEFTVAGLAAPSGADGAGTLKSRKWRYYAEDEPQQDPPPPEPKRNAPGSVPPPALRPGARTVPRSTGALLEQLRVMAGQRSDLVALVQRQREASDAQAARSALLLAQAEAAAALAIATAVEEQELEDDDQEAVALAAALLDL